jgi:hypothetical protein
LFNLFWAQRDVPKAVWIKTKLLQN